MIKLNKEDIILFAGDSITHGGRLERMDVNHLMGHGFQSIISSRLATDNIENLPKFYNKGISGDTVSKIYSRWGDAIKCKPTIINLLIGVNDILTVDTLTPEIVAEKYIYVLRGLLKDTFSLLPDVKFILCEPFFFDVLNQDNPYENIPHPVCEVDFKFGNSDRCEQTIQQRKKALSLIQKQLPDIAKEFNLIYVPFQDIFDEYAKKIPVSYLIWDNIHPTMVGHQLMADRWFEVTEGKI